MTSQQVALIAPLASPLPPPPEGEVLTLSQWRTLMAIADATIPSIEVSSSPSTVDKLGIQASTYTTAIDNVKSALPTGADHDLAQRYLKENPSSVKGFKDLLHRMLGDHINQDARKGVSVILSALDTRAGCLLLTGSTTSFHLQPVERRQQILLNWAESYLPPLRQTYKSLTTLFKSIWLKTSPTIGPVLGFPRVPVHGKPGKGFEYNFLQFPPGSGAEIIETDVVVVGSGCGGAVVAKNLAEAGNRVIVVEKGYYFAPEHLPMTEGDAGVHLFMNGGLESSDDNSIVVIAGQTWGGGGTVNWSASLQTQGFVRKEWADGGLPLFTSSEYQNSLDRVCHRMGVSAEHIEHNAGNRVILEGARKLGYSCKAVPQNTGGNKHYCGYCTSGCHSVQKQGPAVSFLPDAAKAGAHFIEGLQVDKVLFDESKGKKVAIGIKGVWTSRDGNGGVSGDDKTIRQVIIRAKRVIVSAGTLQSPLLLLRSGLKNSQIGQNLHLHPASVVGATFDEETRPWEGGILTTVCDELQNLDSHGHGAKLETTTMLPSWFLTQLNWTGGLDYKLLCLKFSRQVGFISLVRDRDTGRIYPDPVDGRCRIQYTPSAFDKAHALEGIIALAKMNYVAGAREIFTSTYGMPTFVREDVPEGQPDPGINDPKFQAWLDVLRKKGLHIPDSMFASAHQMGTCRMSTSPKTGVVDPQGQVWGTEGLFVSDASVFPSASGVNPMVTNMAISDWVSRGIARGMKIKGRVEGGARL